MSDELKPNQGIFDDGMAAAFAHGEPENMHDYHGPHLIFQKWSWLCGYAEGLRMRMEKAALEARGAQ